MLSATIAVTALTIEMVALVLLIAVLVTSILPLAVLWE